MGIVFLGPPFRRKEIIAFNHPFLFDPVPARAQHQPAVGHRGKFQPITAVVGHMTGDGQRIGQRPMEVDAGLQSPIGVAQGWRLDAFAEPRMAAKMILLPVCPGQPTEISHGFDGRFGVNDVQRVNVDWNSQELVHKRFTWLE